MFLRRKTTRSTMICSGRSSTGESSSAKSRGRFFKRPLLFAITSIPRTLRAAWRFRAPNRRRRLASLVFWAVHASAGWLAMRGKPRPRCVPSPIFACLSYARPAGSYCRSCAAHAGGFKPIRGQTASARRPDRAQCRSRRPTHGRCPGARPSSRQAHAVQNWRPAPQRCGPTSLPLPAIVSSSTVVAMLGQ